MKPRVAATRAYLLRSKRLLSRARQGAQLLRRKREALVRALVPLARPAAEARRDIAETAVAAYAAEREALAIHGEHDVAATAWPSRPLDLDLDVDHLRAPARWGVVVPTLADLPTFERDLEARATAPVATGPALFAATNHFEALAGKLLQAVTRETQVRALGNALARTARQLHTLEQRVIPEVSTRISTVSAALDEHDREDQTRLRALRRR